jgi:hypothetical protein
MKLESTDRHMHLPCVYHREGTLRYAFRFEPREDTVVKVMVEEEFVA